MSPYSPEREGHETMGVQFCICFETKSIKTIFLTVRLNYEPIFTIELLVSIFSKLNYMLIGFDEHTSITSVKLILVYVV